MKRLRIGKTKSILLSSIDSALLAVEIYNKPRTSFRQQSYITLMIIAWTKLFHSYFCQVSGDKFYYKNKNGRYEIVDGERKAWDLVKCIKEYCKIQTKSLSEPAVENLKFFIKLRNKIEHRYVTNKELESLLFGECQALLYNYENLLVNLFGSNYAINENLAFSLQFSQFRTETQQLASKTLFSKDALKIKNYIENYRSNLSESVYNSQEYSIKLIQIPKISNTNRADLAVEFVRWDSLSAKDKENYRKITTIIKDKVVKKPVADAGMFLAKKVLELVIKKTGLKLSHFDHKCLYYIFDIRPVRGEAKEPFDTNPKYCLYNEVFNSYTYQGAWIDFLITIIMEKKINKKKWKQYYKKRKKLSILSCQ